MTPVIEFCERNFLSGMTTSNFYDFITTAKLYSMSSALRQIDTFIANNLLAIARDGTLSLLTYEQLLHCLRCGTLNLHEIDIFQVCCCNCEHDFLQVSRVVLKNYEIKYRQEFSFVHYFAFLLLFAHVW